MPTVQNYTVSFNNKKIWEFYHNNPTIKPESMNLILINFIDTLNIDLSRTVINTIHGETLKGVQDIQTQIHKLEDQVDSITNSLLIKIHDANGNYIETLKTMVGASVNETSDKLTSQLKTNTEEFVDKIRSFFPKNTGDQEQQLHTRLTALQQTIIDEMKTYMTAGNRDQLLKEYVMGLDSKIQTLQQPIYNFISTHQDKINGHFSAFKEQSIVSQSNQEKVISELGEFLNKYRTSSTFKGQYSEHMLEGVLNKMYPTGEIVNTTATKACGDFILKREGRSNILIENKNYEPNVNLDEIKKFLRDINEQKCSGIFMSQYSGIVSKPNYFIEIHDGKVLVYIHHVEYSHEKIKTAVDIIDNLSGKLESITRDNSGSGVVIKKDILDRINAEFQLFVSQKEIIATTIKDAQKRILGQIDDLKLPDLSGFLNTQFASIQNQEWVCDICRAPFATKRCLASHKKIHKGIAPNPQPQTAPNPPGSNADMDVQFVNDVVNS